MSFRLFDRIATLLKADAHGVVDALEERPLLLRQHLRDAELELLQKRARSQALADEETRLRAELARRESDARALDEDVELALGSGKEELARFALKRLLPIRRELAALAGQIEGVVAARGKLAALLERQEGELAALRASSSAWLAAAPAGEAGGCGTPAVADEEVELELLRRRSVGGGGATR